MSASFYTSFETSVALREAGAPQRPARHVPTVCMMESHICWNKDGPEKPWLGPWIGDDFSVRAWRLDEILAALEKLALYLRLGPRMDSYNSSGAVSWSAHALAIEHPDPDDPDWRSFDEPFADQIAASPVEAAAACYLAVLRAAREVRS